MTLVSILVGFSAGVIRGFAGFGGPAFIIAIMTWYLTPLEVIDSVLLIELVAASYLMHGVRADIDWSPTLALALPGLLAMPLGHWFLLHTDAEIMRPVILAAILFSALVMLCNFRLSTKYSKLMLVAIGLVGGVVIGASYIALVFVAFILMAPYNRNETRTMVVVCGFLFAVWYLLLSVYRDRTNLDHIAAAIPMGIAYFAGSWVGVRLFRHATEASYRRYALLLLILLAVVGLVR